MASLMDVYAARRVIQRFLAPPPLLRSMILSERYGCDLWIKYEDSSPIRSFKARGGLYRGSTLPAEYAGVVTASTGNHGQGIALGAAAFGRKAVVYVPEGGNPTKVAAIRALGAELRVAGNSILEANGVARRASVEENLLYVEDGDDPDVMIGCATIALEIVEALPRFDDLIVPAGGGNLLGACGLVLSAVAPEVRVTGVQSSAAPSVYESFREGAARLHPLCATFAGGLATNYPGAYTFTYIQAGVHDMTLVDDDDLIDAAIELAKATSHVPEGAGAAAFAALRSDPARYAGRTVVLILSGANAEPVIWERLTGGA